MAEITLEDVSFRYPGATEDTLYGLDLQIENGEAHALLGASGAGKTTMLNLLSGLLSPTSGRLLFDGNDVSDLPGRERNVAQVFQFPVLYDSLTVAENLAFPLRTRGVATDMIDERVAYICSELSLGKIRDTKPPSLSLFEKQLLAVGKALVRPDVSLVLLDEPLTAVEPKIKWKLRQTLLKVQKDLGVTMIYVTHDQTEALTFAERVSVLSAGGILQTGTPTEIYQSPANEFIGHFVGSPGMNFLPCSAVPSTTGDRIGFRPEWAALVDEGHVDGTVTRVRVYSTQDSKAHGLVTLMTPHGEVFVRGNAEFETGMKASVRIDRCVTFQGGNRVADIAHV